MKVALSVSAVFALGCCAHGAATSGSTGVQPTVEVAPLLRTLRSELERLDEERIKEGKAPLLTLDAVELELSFTVKRTIEAGGEIKLEIVTANTKLTDEKEKVQKLTLKYKPAEGRKGQVGAPQ